MLQITEKQERYQQLDAVVDEVLAEVFPEGSNPSNDDVGQAKSVIGSVKKKVMRELVRACESLREQGPAAL